MLVGEPVQGALLLADRVRHGQDDAEDNQHGRGDPQAAERGLDLVLKEEAQNHYGQDARLAVLGQGWPMTAAHGPKPE